MAGGDSIDVTRFQLPGTEPKRRSPELVKSLLLQSKTTTWFLTGITNKSEKNVTVSLAFSRKADHLECAHLQMALMQTDRAWIVKSPMRLLMGNPAKYHI